MFRPFFIRGVTPSEQRAYDLPESARNVVVYLAAPIRQPGAIEVGEGSDSEIHVRAHVRKCLYDEKDQSRRECNEWAKEMSGLQEGVKIMAMPHKKDEALCSPTSALEKI